MALKYILNVNEHLKNLQSTFPQFGQVKKYHHQKQGDTAELTINNKFNSRFSLTVTLYEFDGVYVDFGDASIIEQELSVDDLVLNVIFKVLNDKCTVIIGYKNIESYKKMKSCYAASFFDDENEEFSDMDEYTLFIKKISSPIYGIKRKFTLNKGVFEVTNWSGSEYKKIIR